MRNSILVNQERCTGCWSCAMACKVAYDLPEGKWRLTVRTIGSGLAMDDPAGEWPNCTMDWQPIYSMRCTMCADRTAKGDLPYCVYNCPSHALTFGNLDDPKSAISKRIEDLRAKGFRIYELPDYEDARKNIAYAQKV